MGKLLLSSFRRTKLNSSMVLDDLSGGADAADTANTINSPGNSAKEGPVPPPKQRVSPNPTPNKASNMPFRDSNDTADAQGGTFVTQRPFGASAKFQEGNQQRSSQEWASPGSQPVPEGRATRVATYPTFTTESFPTCFVTGSYRPRTLAELVLMIVDMKNAVIKTPSLVDDSTPPVKVIAKLNPRGVANAMMNATMRGGKNKHHSGAAASAAAALMNASSGAAPGAGAGPTAAQHASANISAHSGSANASTTGSGSNGPPPLMRGDSGINRAAKLKAAATAVSSGAASNSNTPERNIAPSAHKGTPEGKIAPKNVPSPEHLPLADANLPGKESVVRPSEAVPLATTGKSGSFKGKLVPSAPAPLLKQHSVTSGALSSGTSSGINGNSGSTGITSNTGNGGNGAPVSSSQESSSSAGGNVPAQLRANSRILRPSLVITTPAPVPSPYPTTSGAAAVGSAGSIAPSTIGTARNAVAEHADTAHIKDLDLREDQRRGLAEDSTPVSIQITQSITPSAIIAAAKATLREAEATNSMPSSRGGSRRQSLSRGMQLSALDSSRKTPTARTPNNINFSELEDNFLGSVEEKIHVIVD